MRGWAGTRLGRAFPSTTPPLEEEGARGSKNDQVPAERSSWDAAQLKNPCAIPGVLITNPPTQDTPAAPGPSEPLVRARPTEQGVKCQGDGWFLLTQHRARDKLAQAAGRLRGALEGQHPGWGPTFTHCRPPWSVDRGGAPGGPAGGNVPPTLHLWLRPHNHLGTRKQHVGLAESPRPCPQSLWRSQSSQGPSTSTYLCLCLWGHLPVSAGRTSQ